MPTIYADRIIRNANVITIDVRNPRARAIAIRDGKFVAVGSNRDVAGLKGPNTEVLDLAGATVLPGFIDAHLHTLSSGIRHVMAADCARRSVAEIQDALRERVRATPPGQWVQGFKFDDTKIAENRMLTRRDLDAVSIEHPIYVQHRGGHLGHLNSKALAAVGLTRETPDPPGGRLGREPNGDLNGVLYEQINRRVRSNLPDVSPEIRAEGLRTICGLLNAAGLTTVHDPRATTDDLRTYQQGLARGELTLRVYALITSEHYPAIRDAGVLTGLGDDMLRVGGIKMGVDGAITSRTAWLSRPYVGSEDDYGIPTMTAEDVEASVMDMHKNGFQVCIHANGDSAIDMVLTAYEKAQAAFPRKDPRHRIEHCTLVNPDLLRRIKALGVVATPFCTYVYYHGEKMRFYGEDRLEWMFAQRSFIDNGIVSTGATDYPPGPFEPLMGIQACVTRTDSSGNVWGPSQRVSVEEALRIYTLNGAYASFDEHKKGSIEVGKLADLVVLGADPTAVDPMTIIDIPVLQTIVGGKAVFEA